MVAASATHATDNNNSNQRSSELRIYHHDLIEVRRATASSAGVPLLKSGDEASWQLEFDALGRRFTLDLEYNHRLWSPGAASYSLYRGRLAGSAKSWARVTVIGETLLGIFWDGSELYVLEPMDRIQGRLLNPSPDQRGNAIYRLADTYIEPDSMSCGLPGGAGNSAALKSADQYGALVAELRQRFEAVTPAASQNINIAAIGDFEFTQSFGANSEAELMARFNNVDGIFSEQLGVQISVTEVVLFNDANDPFTAAASEDLLPEVGIDKASTPLIAGLGLAHLYTGRDLDGTTVGVAYLSAICSTQFGVGLSEARRGVLTDSLIAAHEIGHNFGADHDGATGSPCEATPETFLMAPAIIGSSNFSQCSLDTMAPVAAAGSCLTPLALSDAAVSADSLSSGTAGVAFQVEFTVSSEGSQSAGNTVVTAQLPAALGFFQATVANGSCTPGAGTVSCQLGDLASGTSRTVTLSLDPTQAGQLSLDVSVSAYADQNANNDSDAMLIDIAPSVDLSVQIDSLPNQLDNGSSATLSATVRNDGISPASGIRLEVTVPDALRVDSAQFGSADCAINGVQVLCQANTLNPGAMLTTSIAITAIQNADVSVELDVSAVEIDLDGGNDNVSRNVTIGSPPPAGGDPGGQLESGGGIMLTSLLPLFFLLRHRRRKVLPG